MAFQHFKVPLMAGPYQPNWAGITQRSSGGLFGQLRWRLSSGVALRAIFPSTVGRLEMRRPNRVDLVSLVSGVLAVQRER